MRKNWLNFLGISLLFLGFSIFTNCSSSDDGGGLLQNNGLTKDINDIVPDSILQEIEELGMPVNTGDNPPNIEGYFLASPLILINSNRPGDTPGTQYADYYVRFYNQDNKDLTVNMDYVNSGESGSGLGSYIVGDDNNFSVFAELHSTYSGDDATLLILLSGTLTSTEITDFYYALFMLDNEGNPHGFWIANGDGRVFYDSDGSSPAVSGFPKLSHENIQKAISAALQKK